MKIQTNNRLAHYQVELNEVSEQTYMLQVNIGHLYQEINVLSNYLSANSGDLHSRNMYKAKVKEYRSLKSKVNRNTRRIETLRRQIALEGSKMMRGR